MVGLKRTVETILRVTHEKTEKYDRLVSLDLVLYRKDEGIRWRIARAFPAEGFCDFNKCDH
jgi:hypothetical protein